MGSYSVYCEASKIAITSGTKCRLVPLIKPSLGSGMYFSYALAAPPILGEYDDYGGIENIVPSESTKMIEEHFGLSIQEFCNFLTDRHRSDAPSPENMKDLRYAWVHEKVYQLMMNTQSVEALDHIPFGNIGFLLDVGATKVEKKNDQRYRHSFLLNGKEIRTDGRWIEDSVYHLSTFAKRYKVNVDKYKNWRAIDLWRVNDVSWRRENMMHYYGVSSGTASLIEMEELVNRTQATLKSIGGSSDLLSYSDHLAHEKTKFSWKIVMSLDNDELCREVAESTKFVASLYTISTDLRPSTSYLTPQCGDHKTHLKLVDGFKKILKEELNRYKDDE